MTSFAKIWQINSEPAPPVPTKTILVLKLIFWMIIASLILGVTLLIPVTITTVGVRLVADELAKTPDPSLKLVNIKPPSETIIYSSQGNEIARIFDENRQFVKISEISPNIINALISTEDQDFYKHGGVDSKAIIRSAINNLKGNPTQGSSTITMQLVKNLNNIDRQSEGLEIQGMDMKRKIRQAWAATKIEKRLTKKQILELYLNTVNFGNHMYGIKMASEYYYNKPPKNLNPNEAAILIGLLKGPEVYGPIKNPNNAVERKNLILNLMHTQGHLTKTELDKWRKHGLDLAKTDRTKYARKSTCRESKYPYYCDMVMKELAQNPAIGKTEEERKLALFQGGMKIYTALDETQMSMLEDAYAGFNKNQAWKLGSTIIENNTGNITAISQSTNYNNYEINLNQAKFQVGSSFKPITIAAAFENNISPNMVYYSGNGYKPAGLDHPPNGFKNTAIVGNINMYQATRISNNVYFVKILEKLGVKTVAEMAQRLGIESINPDNLTGREASLTLGVYPTSSIEMASLYSTFGNNGTQCEPKSITKIITNSNKTIEVKPKCEQKISPKIAGQINDILKQPFQGGGTLSIIGNPYGKMRGKSGSTDNWQTGDVALYTKNRTMYTFAVDPAHPTSNPLDRGFNVYGQTFYPGSVAAGVYTAGPYIKRVFPYLTRNDTTPETNPQNTGGNNLLLRKIKPDPTNYVGMNKTQTIRLLMENPEYSKILIKNTTCPQYITGSTKKVQNNIIYICNNGKDETVTIISRENKKISIE